MIGHTRRGRSGYLLVRALPAILAAALLAAAPQPTQAADPTDVTFFVGGDWHFGYTGTTAGNDNQIAAMNARPGKAYPVGFAAATVATPVGVWAAGDLTEATPAGPPLMPTGSALRTAAQIAAAAEEHYQRAQAALQEWDWARAGEEMEALKQKLAELREALD